MALRIIDLGSAAFIQILAVNLRANRLIASCCD
jgi:hypothetical protein